MVVNSHFCAFFVHAHIYLSKVSILTFTIVNIDIEKKYLRKNKQNIKHYRQMKRSTHIYKISNTSNKRQHIALHLRAICCLNFTADKNLHITQPKPFCHQRYKFRQKQERLFVLHRTPRLTPVFLQH